MLLEIKWVPGECEHSSYLEGQCECPERKDSKNLYRFPMIDHHMDNSHSVEIYK